MNTANQKITLPLLGQKNILLSVKREDLIHPFISGNKYRKLKYNLMEAKKRGYTKILTFGGAYSNHIAATAYAGKIAGFTTVGAIRGDELENNWSGNPTLAFAQECGMHFHFMSRAAYKKKQHSEILNSLKNKFGNCYVLPEGGTNTLAVKGCEEIVTSADYGFDVVATAVGTGGTIAGIINASKPPQHVIGFPALKGDFLKEDIRKFVRNTNWELRSEYHFGGYAKVNTTLIQWINDFRKRTQIPLDPIYTGKMMFGLLDLIANDYFAPGTKIVAIHTGGLQGIQGMNKKLKKKNLPLLHI